MYLPKSRHPVSHAYPCNSVMTSATLSSGPSRTHVGSRVSKSSMTTTATATTTTLLQAWRMGTVICVTLIMMLVILGTFYLTTAFSTLIGLFTVTRDPLCPHYSPRERGIRLGNLTQMVQITTGCNEVMYLHKEDMLIHLALKGGSVALLTWIYNAHAQKEWDMEGCETYIQNLSSPCWNNEASFLYDLSPSRQWQIYTSSSTLRVALQRDPYDRLISAFKSKYTCEHERFHSDVLNTEYVPMLRKHANVPFGKPCMNVSEFASLLDKIRVTEGRDGVGMVMEVEAHIRPQQLHMDKVDYHVVLDARNMSNPTLMSPLYERLPGKEFVQPFVPMRHTSGGDALVVPPEAEAKLRKFAAISDGMLGPVKTCV